MTDIFRREYLGEWYPTECRCEVTTNRERCPNVAKYVLHWGEDREGYVCDSCLSAWVHEFTQKGPVIVTRIPKDPK